MYKNLARAERTLASAKCFFLFVVLESKESGHELQILHLALKVQLLVTVQELPAADLAKVKEALSPGANLQSGVPCFC